MQSCASYLWQIMLFYCQKKFFIRLQMANSTGTFDNPILIDAESPISSKTTPTTKDLNISLGPVKVSSSPADLILVSYGPNQTSVLTSHPYRNCPICSPVIQYHLQTKQAFRQLKLETNHTSCSHRRYRRCKRLRKRFLKLEQRDSEDNLILFLELHLRSHPRCGNIKDIPHG